MTLILILLLISLTHVSKSQNTIKNLNQKLFSTYDGSSRPVQYANNATEVCVGLYVLQISNVKEKSQVMQANIQFVFLWKDNFLNWNHSDYENITIIQVKSSVIWTPDIIILNSADMNSRDYRDKYLLRVTDSGFVRWQFQFISSSFCEIDIMNFPFDEQICFINIRSSAYDKYRLQLKPRNKKVKVEETIKTEWFIVDSSVKNSSLFIVNDYGVTEYTVLNFSLKLRRVITYYIFKIIFPFSMIALITLFTFWLAPDSGEKLTLDVTILLSLVLYLQYMSEYIPRSTTSLPLLTIFALTNFFLVFLSSIMSVFVLRLYHTPTILYPKYKQELPYIVRLILFRYMGKLLFHQFPVRKPITRKTAIFQCYCHNSSIKQTESNEYSKILKRIYKNYKASMFKNDADSQAKNILYTLKSLNKSIQKDITGNSNNNTDTDTYYYNSHIYNPTNININKTSITNTNINNYNNNINDHVNTMPIYFNKTNTSFSNNNTNFVENNCNNCNAKLFQEEWKQAALVLDRLLFYVFLVCMPLTITVFFKVNVIEYILSSNVKRDFIIENGC